MGWAKDVAELIVRNDFFRLNINDAVRLRELDAMEQRISAIEKQLAASQAREAKLRACVELYADEKNWAHTNDGPTVKAVVLAQKCLEELK